MKTTVMTICLALILALLIGFLLFTPAKKAHADSGASTPSAVGYSGYLDVKAPVWNSGSGYVDSSNPLEIDGKLTLRNVFGRSCPIRPFVAGDYTLGRSVFAAKAELQAGIEYPVGRQVMFFSYYDRHYQENVNRVFVGLRFGFQGGGY